MRRRLARRSAKSIHTLPIVLRLRTQVPSNNGRRSRSKRAVNGQIEISAPPSLDATSAIRGAERDAREVMTRLADVGMAAVAIGLAKAAKTLLSRS